MSVKRVREYEEVPDAKKPREEESEGDESSEGMVKCDLCEEKFDSEDMEQIVTGIGSVWSNAYTFPVAESEILTLCGDCCQGHGDIDTCVVCKRNVIGQTIDGKCRVCFSEHKALKLLKKFHFDKIVRAIWRKVHDWDEMEFNDPETNYYAAFFEEDGEKANESMHYLELAMWLDSPEDKRTNLDINRKMNIFYQEVRANKNYYE